MMDSLRTRLMTVIELLFWAVLAISLALAVFDVVRGFDAAQQDVAAFLGGLLSRFGMIWLLSALGLSTVAIYRQTRRTAEAVERMARQATPPPRRVASPVVVAPAAPPAVATEQPPRKLGPAR